VHHVGNFSTLEDQMCAFTSDFDRGRNGYSPDRVDALVWALTELSGPVHTTWNRPVSVLANTKVAEIPWNHISFRAG
jgi:phage terminase large subunit-like protein